MASDRSEMSPLGNASAVSVSRETAAVGTDILSYDEPLQHRTQQTPESGDRLPAIPSEHAELASGAADDFGVDLSW